MKNEWVLKELLIAIIGCLSVAGCGGGGSHDNGNLFPSDSLKLSEISNNDAARFCSVYQDRANKILTPDKLCTFGAVIITTASSSGDHKSDIATCSDYKNKCIAENDKNPDSTESSCSISDANLRKTCSATTGELEQCTNDILDQLDSILSDISCSMIGEKNINKADINAPESPACVALKNKCPELFADMNNN